MWILHEKFSTGKYKNVPGKYQYGDSGHAKKRAEKDYGGKLFWERGDADFTGKDKSGKIWYHIQWRETNPMKKKRKKNPERITQAWLEKRAGLINQMLKRPAAAYTDTGSGLKSNAGHFYIDSAYGGVGLEMMAKGGGAHAISGGHVPKRELSNFMDGFIAAIREIQSSRVNNPGKRKAAPKKKTTRKKNPKDTDRVFYAANAVYSVEFNGNGWYVFRNDNYGTHVEHFAGPGDAGKKDAIEYLKALKKSTAKAPGSNPAPYYAIRLERTGEYFYRGRGGWAKPVKPIKTFSAAQSARKRIAQNLGYDENELNIVSFTSLNAFMEPNPKKKKPRKRNSDWRSHYNIFKCKGKDVRWLKGFAVDKPRWTLTRGDAAKYEYEHQARVVASHAYARGWQVGVVEKGTQLKEIIEACSRGKARRSNPVGPTQKEVDGAQDLFRAFTGEHPERMKNVKLPVPKTGLVIGELDGVLYTTVRDGKTEKYQHDFKKGSRPLLASSHDGQSLHVLGGEYEFTERGIEDK